MVLDSSAAIELLVRRDRGEWVADRVEADSDLHVPHLLDVEVASGLRSLVIGGKLSERAARRGLDDFGDFALRRYAHTLLLDRVWQLRTHLTVYDALYVALAEALDADLVTVDLRLARSRGHRARIVAPE